MEAEQVLAPTLMRTPEQAQPHDWKESYRRPPNCALQKPQGIPSPTARQRNLDPCENSERRGRPLGLEPKMQIAASRCFCDTSVMTHLSSKMGSEVATLGARRRSGEGRRDAHIGVTCLVFFRAPRVMFHLTDAGGGEFRRT